MMIKQILFLILFFDLSFTALFAQQGDSLLTFELNEPIIVTASRTPVTLMRSARTVSVLDSAMLVDLHVNSVQDALEYVSGVDIQQRGGQGVQADISLRGSTYEQTLILIDGVKTNDPQTGHHNLNLPLTLQDVQRIEVLKGAGSRIYGPNAFGGVINIITRKAKGKKLLFSATGGDFGYREGNLNFGFPTGKLNHNLSISGSASEGYRPNTDFEKYSLFYQN